MRAVDSEKVSILVIGLLDLSAAFDTVDHNILLPVLRDRFSIEDTIGSTHISQTAINLFVHNDQQTTFFPLDCTAVYRKDRCWGR